MQGFAKAMRTVVILAALAGATQFLWQSLSYGDTLASTDTQQPAAEPTEKFAQASTSVSSPSPSDDNLALRNTRFMSGATLEMRSEVTIEGGDVKLKQICRWSASDQEAFAPIADLVVTKIAGGTAFRAMTQDDLKSTLSDAGVNLAIIHFAGAQHCTISRSDVAMDEHAALQEWANARMAVGPATQPAAEATLVASATSFKVNPATQPAQAVDVTAKTYHTLRERLIADLSERLSLDPNVLEMHFSPGDEKVLALSEPLFQFDLQGLRVHNIGDVCWQVAIYTNGTRTSAQKTTINAVARVWQEQLMVRKPMLYHPVSYTHLRRIAPPREPIST